MSLRLFTNGKCILISFVLNLDIHHLYICYRTKSEQEGIIEQRLFLLSPNGAPVDAHHKTPRKRDHPSRNRI